MRTYCIAQGALPLYPMFCGDPSGKEIQKRGNVCTYIADSLCYIAETNTTLQSNYTPIKIDLKNSRFLLP